jgi:hypothetical protein
LDLSDSGFGSVAGSCEYGNDLMIPHKVQGISSPLDHTVSFSRRTLLYGVNHTLPVLKHQMKKRLLSRAI